MNGDVVVRIRVRRIKPGDLRIVGWEMELDDGTEPLELAELAVLARLIRLATPMAIDPRKVSP